MNLLDETVDEGWITAIHGDACTADWLTETFDVVISNSVLEHVGGVVPPRRLPDVGFQFLATAGEGATSNANTVTVPSSS